MPNFIKDLPPRPKFYQLAKPETVSVNLISSQVQRLHQNKRTPSKQFTRDSKVNKEVILANSFIKFDINTERLAKN